MSEVINMCEKGQFLFKVAGTLVSIVRFVVPVILVILIVVDVVKTLSSSSAPDTKALFTKSATRFGFAVLIFFIPSIVYIILGEVAPAEDSYSGITGALNCLKEYIK